MKQIILMLFVGVMSTKTMSAQEISKDKNVSISNVKAAGYSIEMFPNENKFAFIRYDNFGSALVCYEYTGNTVRRVSFLCLNPKMATERLRDILANIPLEEYGKPQQEHGIWEIGSGRMYTSKSRYYKGDAIYSTSLNHEERTASFIIDIL